MSGGLTEQALPDGWRWVKLGDVTEIISGQSPPGETYRNTPIGLPFFQGKTDFGRRNPVPRMWCVSPVKLAKSGDILISVRAPVGPTNVADQECCIGRGLAAIRCNALVNSEFVLAALRLFESDLVKKGSGSTFQAINRDDLINLAIPLPPLPEQKRIAAILTEKMAAVEKARAAAEARLKAAKELPAAYLREVFESDEAQAWPSKRLGDLATVIQNGIYKSAEHYGHGQPFVRMYNLPNSHWKLKLETLAQVSLDDSEKQRFVLHKDDLLVSRVNSFELVGKCSWVGQEADGYAFENMLIRVRFGNDTDPKFVAQQFGTSQVRQQIEKVAKRAIGQASINSEDLRSMELLFPPIDEQRRLSRMIDEKTSASANLCSSIESELEAIKSMPPALLRQAFAGEL